MEKEAMEKEMAPARGKLRPSNRGPLAWASHAALQAMIWMWLD
jgi:hypothetical protein